MAITAKVYKGGTLLGTGVGTPGSNVITGYAAFAPGGNTPVRRCGHRRTVFVECTGGVSSNGVFKTRVEIDQTLLVTPVAALTLRSACPFT